MNRGLCNKTIKNVITTAVQRNVPTMTAMFSSPHYNLLIHCKVMRNSSKIIEYGIVPVIVHDPLNAFVAQSITTQLPWWWMPGYKALVEQITAFLDLLQAVDEFHGVIQV